jgi:hypothetical protein
MLLSAMPVKNVGDVPGCHPEGSRKNAMSVDIWERFLRPDDQLSN